MVKIELLDGPAEGKQVLVGLEYAKSLLERGKAREIKARKKKAEK